MKTTKINKQIHKTLFIASFASLIALSCFVESLDYNCPQLEHSSEDVSSTARKCLFQLVYQGEQNRMMLSLLYSSQGGDALEREASITSSLCQKENKQWLIHHQLGFTSGIEAGEQEPPQPNAAPGEEPPQAPPRTITRYVAVEVANLLPTTTSIALKIHDNLRISNATCPKIRQNKNILHIPVEYGSLS